MKKLAQRLDSIRPDEEGEYRYTGSLYGAEDAPQKLFWGLIVGELLLILLSGSFSTPGTTGKSFVIIPYVVELCSACTVAMGLGKLGRDWTALRDYIYDYARVLPLRCLFAFCAAVCGAVGEFISMMQEQDLSYTSLVFITLRLISALSMLLFRKKWLAIEWRESK